MHENLAEFLSPAAAGSGKFSEAPVRHSASETLDVFRLDRVRAEVARGLLSTPEIPIVLAYYSRARYPKVEAPPEARYPTPSERVLLGERAVRQLSSAFLARHQGEFVAVSLDGKLLCTARELSDLLGQLQLLKPTFDYYVARLGTETIGPLR